MKMKLFQIGQQRSAADPDSLGDIGEHGAPFLIDELIWNSQKGAIARNVLPLVMFLPDPGVSGVRSMGPGVPPYESFG